jgi:hypothetical protein
MYTSKDLQVTPMKQEGRQKATGKASQVQAEDKTEAEKAGNRKEKQAQRKRKES